MSPFVLVLKGGWVVFFGEGGEPMGVRVVAETRSCCQADGGPRPRSPTLSSCGPLTPMTSTSLSDVQPPKKKHSKRRYQRPVRSCSESPNFMRAGAPKASLTVKAVPALCLLGGFVSTCFLPVVPLTGLACNQFRVGAISKVQVQ